MQGIWLYYVVVPRKGSNSEDFCWESQLRKGSLDLAILAVLWTQRRYGLEIIRELKALADVDLAEGTLYPILLRLTQEQLLDSEWVGADSGHQRKYYALSKSGRRRAIEMMHTWDGFSAAMFQLTQPMREKSYERQGRRDTRRLGGSNR